MTSEPRPDPLEKDVERLRREISQYPSGRVPRALRREHVLSLATGLFVERGFVNASMDELARRAGVSKPVIYDLVGSKDALFHEIVMVEAKLLTERVQAAVNAEPELAQKLRAGMLAFFEYVVERRSVWLLLTAPSEGAVVGELAAARRVQARSVAALLTRFAEETGKTLEPRSIDAVAHALNGAAEGLALWWNDHPDMDAAALADIVTRLVLPGLLSFAQQSD